MDTVPCPVMVSNDKGNHSTGGTYAPRTLAAPTMRSAVSLSSSLTALLHALMIAERCDDAADCAKASVVPSSRAPPLRCAEVHSRTSPNTKGMSSGSRDRTNLREAPPGAP